MTTLMPQDISELGGIKGRMTGRKGFPVLSFQFLVVKFEVVEIIGLV